MDVVLDCRVSWRQGSWIVDCLDWFNIFTMIDVKKLDPVMKQVKVILLDTEKNKMNAQKMLSNASRLAVLLTNVSQFWIEARYDADIAKADYDNKYDSTFIEMKKSKQASSDETAKTLARIECREIYLKWLELDRLSRRLYNMREDMDRQVSVWQSLASELRSQLVYRRGGDPVK